MAQLNVSHELVPAIEAAFGRFLHALVLRDAGRAAEVAPPPNWHQLGQAALVLEGIAHRDRPTKDSPPTAIDWAANKVQAAEPGSPSDGRLLDRVALFLKIGQDALIAIRGSGTRSHNAGWRIHLACGSSLRGARESCTDSLLERKARIEAIVTELTKLRLERDSLLLNACLLSS